MRLWCSGGATFCPWRCIRIVGWLRPVFGRGWVSIASQRNLSEMKKELKSAATSAALGIGWILGGLWLFFGIAGNPLDDFALIHRGQVAQGFIVETWEDADTGDEGGAQWSHSAVYEYRLPDGREFTQRTRTKSGRLKRELRDLSEPFPIEVEYLPDNPIVSRIKGSGSSSLFDWLWRKVGLGLVLLAIILTPGLWWLRDAFREIVRYQQSSNSASPSKQ